MITRSGREASQQPLELERLVDILMEKRVASYLEIGARHGDTFYEIVRSLPKTGLYVAVDLPNSVWGSSWSMDCLIDCVEELQKQGYNAHYVLGDSRAPEVIELIQSLGRFDAVLIDGDHRYDGVFADFSNYGGAKIVAFHDIAGDGLVCGENPVEVPIFWREIKDKYEHEEIVQPSDDRPMGIGVIYR